MATTAMEMSQRQSRLGDVAKRLVDLAGALFLTIVLLPVVALIAIAIKLDSPGPAFFRQKRRGRSMQPFTFVKFRSLAHGAPDPSRNYEMVEDDPRITRVGSLLRKTSLDELPQLFNVLQGTMSLVGPRPLVEWESQAALRTHPERYEVKPGITGLSQVTVRNSVGFLARLDKDVEYARNQNLLQDLVILLRTPLAVVVKEGVYPESR